MDRFLTSFIYTVHRFFVSLNNISLHSLLLISTFVIGVSGSALWLFASTTSIDRSSVALMGCVQACVLLFPLMRVFQGLNKIIFSHVEKLCVVCIGILMSVYVLGVVLPETGFDALWYHLPITRVTLLTGRTIVIPDLYQSVQPRLGAFLFMPFFALGKEAGVKLFSFLITLLFILLLYVMSRTVLSRTWALLTTIAVLSLHTISWQVTSAYVDIPKALFEFAAISILLKTSTYKLHTIGMAIPFIAFMLLTKTIAVLFFPALIVLTLVSLGILPAVMITLFPLIPLAAIQIEGKSLTGIYPLPQMLMQTSKELIVEQKTLLETVQWGIIQELQLFILPLKLTFHTESYTHPLFLFGIPFVFTTIRKSVQLYWRWWLYIGLSFAIWFVIPPLSIRYVIVPLFMLLILTMYSVEQWSIRIPMIEKVVCMLVLVSALMTAGIRMGVLYRGRDYLMGRESAEQYVRRFIDPINKGPIEKWYGDAYQLRKPSL